MELSLGTMLFQLVTFIILMLLVSKFALRPMLGVLKQRQDYIDKQISTAEENRKEAEKMAEKQKEALNEARREAKEILERAKAQKDREAEEIIKEARERAERMLQDAKSEIASEKEKALKELRDEVGHLTVLLASKVMEKELDSKDQSKLVDRYLERVGELQ
ncbi:ATP synthase F0 subcomplex B subunit [Melghirimyces profundicolus]|uniref:ATP synthase subunit b n=1 Tax=Melghirimyces profundicolus TaxID=1242148 RepID=A0A2T6C2J1_9BACL|nr:F0F1 ATP synthase subunit B [Melghirimyces profundicolus]PTX62513.1 ATP synthase F0 subcomplex B subunit [Melghirimyces profundicolus]